MFQETLSALIELPEDDPAIIELMLNFCYGWDYDAAAGDIEPLVHAKLFAV
jgi:hypothetical protein